MTPGKQQPQRGNDERDNGPFADRNGNEPVKGSSASKTGSNDERLKFTQTSSV